MLANIRKSIVVIIVALSWAQAATWVVTKVADTNDGVCDVDCSLREAVAAAADGDTITFIAGLSGQRIVLSGTEIVVPQANLTIDASALATPVIVEAGGSSRIFNQTNNLGVFTLNGLELSGGSSARDGGAVYSSSNISIFNSTIYKNQARDSGGGIYSDGNIILDKSQVTGNRADSLGGGLFGAASIDIKDSVISVNTTFSFMVFGSGIYGVGDVVITNSLISDNSGLDFGFGGGVYSYGDVTLFNTTVINNQVDTDGGGIYAAGTVVLNNSLVLGNRVVGGGVVDTQVVGGVDVINNSSAYAFDDLTPQPANLGDVFVDPRPLGDYRLVENSPAINAGDNAIVPAGLTADIAGNPRIQNGTVDMGAYEGVFRGVSGSVINPNQDMQIRNGDSTVAETITSRGFIPLRYGPFKRNETVTLSYLVRNPGAKTLELGELSLPPFFSVVSDALPEQLASFESAVLIVEVDTSSAGSLVGQVSLTSNDPDSHENPFVFDVIVNVGDEPANALYVLPGITLEDVTLSGDEQSVPVYSARLLVPEGSADVSLNSLALTASDVPALRDATSLTLVIDGGIRGVYDARDVVLARLEPPFTSDGTITLTFLERTLAPNLPLWILLVADF
ncbi:MAG: choice-of-anchor Q domain-containing protein [Deinococcota bacterium]